MCSVGWLTDNAMNAIGRENAKKHMNALNKIFACTPFDSYQLPNLIAHFEGTEFNRNHHNSQPLD